MDSKLIVIELLCPIAFMCLYSYSQDAGAICKQMAARRKGHGAEPDVKGSSLHRLHESCCVLFKLAPELHDMAHSKTCEHIVVDEFVQGLAEVHRTGKTPMWLVVACQTYLDIYDLLGSYVSHGVDALQDTFKKHKQVAADVAAYQSECADSMADVYDALDKLNWVAKALNRFEEAVWLPPEGEHQATSKKQVRIKEELGCSASATERSLPAHAGASSLTSRSACMMPASRLLVMAASSFPWPTSTRLCALRAS